MKGFGLSGYLFVVLCMLASFCITCEFAIAKPVSNSIFLYHYGAEWMPFAWLALLPLNYIVVKGYNKLLHTIGPIPLFGLTTVLVSILNVATALYVQEVPLLSFLQFTLKDIYILLMFQQLWSVIHVTIKMKEAKYLYGFIFGVGGLGSFTGSFLTSTFATVIGSENLLFFTPAIYAVYCALFIALVTVSKWHTGCSSLDMFTGTNKSTRNGFQLVGSSKYLQYILIIVVAMQLTTTLVEYQFNHYLEMTYPEMDPRTAYQGKLFSWVNGITALMQFFGSAAFVHVMGLVRAQMFMPLILTGFAVGNVLFPTFAMMSLAYGSIKSLDYSVFRVATEMLYIPLTVEEKFKAKSVIDVFAYRSAKALGSFIVLALQWLFPLFVHESINVGAFIVLILWLFATYGIAKEKEHPHFTSQ